MSGRPSAGWVEALRLHEEAATELVAAAEAVPVAAWAAPREPGKWSPSQVVEHLLLVYDVLLQQLGGAGGMAIRTGWAQRVVLRWLVQPRLLAGGRFPAGVRAPREVRPGAEALEQWAALARFRARAAEFQAAMGEARTARPRQRLTHAYLGTMSLEQALRFCAVHIRHHRAQLPAGSTREQRAG